MCTQSTSELERPSWPGQGASQRESERVIVPFTFTDNITVFEGRACSDDHAKGGAPLESFIATNQPEQRTTVLQTKLYEAAKADKARCFHALHDKLYLPYIMQCAWEMVRRNKGCAGIDRQTLKDIEEYGVDLFPE